MAVIKVGNNSIGKISVIEPYDDPIGHQETATTPWVRPSHWLDMPTIASGEDKCAFLFAVASGYTMDNHVSIYARGLDIGTIETDFTIDWGDGTTHTCNEVHSRYTNPVASTGSKNYNFDDLPESTQFNYNGTEYRQALITFESPSSGISIMRFWSSKNYTGGFRYPNYNFLEIDINLISGVDIGGNTYGYNTRRPLLEKARVYAPLATNLNYYLCNAARLRSLEFGPFNNLNNVIGLFQGCESLDAVPDIDISNATRLSSFFNNAGIEHYRNNYDLTNVTGVDSMFSNCKKLKTAHVDLPNVTNITNMFYNCTNLISVSGDFSSNSINNASQAFRYNRSLVYGPNINLSGVTNADYMYEGCRSLRKTPRLFMPNLTIARSMFSSCISLEEVDIEDMSATNQNRAESMFSSCTSLKKVNIGNVKLNFSNYGGANFFFSSCVKLRTVNGEIDTSGSQSLQNMFNGCSELVHVDNIKTPTIYNFNSMFYNCAKLKKIPFTDITCEGTGNVDMYRTFRGCGSLQEIPNFDYSRTWRLRETFDSCSSVSGGIENLNLDLNNGTVSTDVNNFYAPFNSCSIEFVNQMSVQPNGTLRYLFRSATKLKRVPYVDVSGVSDAYQMFENTYDLAQGAVSGLDVNIGYYRSMLPSGEIVKLFNGLASGVTSKTVDLRDVPEVAILTSDDIAIATNKGWTVTT
jgi:hypothetical protein